MFVTTNVVVGLMERVALTSNTFEGTWTDRVPILLEGRGYVRECHQNTQCMSKIQRKNPKQDQLNEDFIREKEKGWRLAKSISRPEQHFTS